MPQRPFTALLCLGTTLAALPAGALTLLGLFPELQERHVRAAQLASFIHFAGPLWLLVLLGAVLAMVRLRLRIAIPVAIAALLAVGIHALWLAPYFRADRQPSEPLLEVTVLNVEFGYADGAALAERMSSSEVVVLLEVTPETVTALSRAGMDRRFPHRIGRGAEGAAGTVIYSRLPMTDLGPGPTAQESRLVRVATPTGPVLIAGVHPVNPMTDVDSWVQDSARLHSWLAPYSTQELVVAGDFNAIDRHLTMQPFWRSGFVDAADLAASGPLRTWPTNHPRLPMPILGIDHVLLAPRLTASRHEVLWFPETDHAGLRVAVGRRTQRNPS